jgi:Flp pilus assembly protein CpaB
LLVAVKTDLAATAAAANGHRGLMPPPGPELRRKERRRFGLIAGAVVLVLAAGLAVGLAVVRAGGKVSVIVMARPVPVGHTIDAADLTTAQMAGDSIPAYAGNHMNEVIGKVAAVGLVKGEVLNPAMVSTRVATPPGYVVAGALLKAGQLPAGGVSAGDKVTVILLTGTSSGASSNAASGAAPSVLETDVTVTDSAEAADGSGTVVSLLIPRTDAAQLAQANSAGLVALAQVPSS